MNFPSSLKYTKSHEWARQDGEKTVVGITEYAQHELSDVVYVELPKIGQEVKQGVACCIVESVKAAFDIYAPVSGKIVKINDELSKKPEIVNQSPYEKGWLFEIECADPKEVASLLTEAQYQSVKDAAHH